MANPWRRISQQSPGLHAKMPPIEAQLPLLRALWPSPFVRLPQEPAPLPHGAYGYESAKAQYAPFDRLQDPDPTSLAPFTGAT